MFYDDDTKDVSWHIYKDWTGSKVKWFFYRISELMLATYIQGYDKKSLYFWSSANINSEKR